MKDCKVNKKIMTNSIAIILLAIISSAGFCQGSVALMIQQTPPQGGSVSPGIGVHDMQKNSVVTLTATPKPGYQFVYWLGDVSDATSATTIASLESPKMIIAVFERNEFAFTFYDTEPPSAPNEKLRGSYQESGSYSNNPVGGRRGSSRRYYNGPDPDPDPDDNYFPVPDEGDDINDFPVPEVPEPMTIILLGLGSAFISARKRKR